MGGGRVLDEDGRSGYDPDAPGVAIGARSHKRPAQRERLIQAMIELAAERGYREVTVAGVSSRAGVSSATFYEQFPNKEACLVSAHRESAERVLRATRGAIRELQRSGARTPEALRAALKTLMVTIQREPDAARILFIEGLSGAPRLREASVRVLDRMESGTEAAIDSVAAGEGPIDLPAIALVGAVRNVVSRRLRVHGEDRLLRIVDPLAEWIMSYRLPAGAQRWTNDARLGMGAQAAAVIGRRGYEPFGRSRLPRGRHGLTPGQVIRSQRTRIIAATAEVTMEKGYASTTVADIVAAAGVAKDAFYEHFQDKEHAFLEAQQHPTQFILDRCAEAYFQVPDWPHRLWNHLETLVRMIVENPAIAHLRLVECYAAGPAAVQRAEEITRAFNIFLEEGYAYAAPGEQRPHLFSEAITGGIFEIIRTHTARGEPWRLVGMLPQLTYLGLAPFVGAAEAIEMVEQLSHRPATVRN
jgi:AcrR family transcriptional regulator